MKKTYIFIIAAVILAAFQPSKAQWTQVSSPTTKSLSAVYFIDENTGFVTGDLPGILFKTTNGGAFYSAINTHTDEIINSIYFVNSSTGFTVGSLNKIARSTNGGNNWTVVNTGNAALHCIHFPSNTVGYAVGGTFIYKTSNGGITWSQLNYTPGTYLKGVFFISINTGYICGSNGAIYKTTTGGSNWNQQTSTVTGFLEDIYFINSQTGFAIGQNGAILKTVNAGSTWTNYENNTSWYKSMSIKIWNYTNQVEGWICGSDGKILKSSNNGNSWNNQTSGVTSDLNDICFVNTNTGYAVGNEGVILKTTNGGGNITPSNLFEKVISGQLVNELTSSNYSAWGDYDNDGYQDVVISQFNDNCYSCGLPLLLFKNNENGTFTKTTNNAIVNTTIGGSGLAWGDYNNDGLLDLFATGTVNSKNILFRNDGNGNFTKITTGYIVNDIAWSQTCAWTDYNKDGWLDIFVTNRDAQANFLYKNNGNETFTKITSGSIVNDIGASRSSTWGDYDNDGWSDLFVLNFEGQDNFLYKNNGNGSFTKIFNAPMVNDNQWGSNCAWIDFDNDGNLDLYISNLNGTNRLYYNHGNGTFTLNNSILSQETSSHGFSWGDYDNDGKIDVIICKPGGVNNLYRNLGNSNFMKITNEIVGQEGGYSIGAAWADINNSGKLDLFITNRNFTGYNYLYKNVGSLGNYLVCKLKGCESNKFGIGARIKIVKDDFVAYRYISGGGSWSQSMLPAHFGIGNITSVDSVIVYWPSNNVTRLSNVSANQILTIEECENSSVFFTKIINDPVATEISYFDKSSWVDYNKDGFMDVLISTFNDNCLTCNYPIYLFKNNGNGSFEKVTANNSITQETTKTGSSAWADYNNDGFPDVFIGSNFNNKNFLYKNLGNGNFEKILTGSIANDIAWSQACAWADYDKDGFVDLFVANRNNEKNFLYKNNGDGTFTKITQGEIVNDINASRNCIWGDYNNDGWPDLYVLNYEAQNNSLYKNNGNGTFTKITSGPQVNDGLWGSNCQWFDFNNDGYLDIFVTNHNGPNKLYINNGNGSFIESNNENIGSNSYGFSIGDYDNDGFADIFITNVGQMNSLLKNNNGNSFYIVNNEIVAKEGGNSHTSSWTDINNDGKLDLLVSQRGNHKNFFYKNIGNAGNYLTIKLTGCASNKMGIGAKVRVVKGDFKSIKEFSGGGGWGHNMQWAHFGLKDFNTIDSLIIYWPSNSVSVFTNVSTNQILEIEECTSNITSTETPTKYFLKQNYPNPFNPVTKIDYSILNSSKVILNIYDVSGKLVSQLVNQIQPAGNYTVIFDANSLSSGFYFYDLRVYSDDNKINYNNTKKMILLK